MDQTAIITHGIVRNPTRENHERIWSTMRTFGCDPDAPDFTASREPRSDPSLVACAYILKRCGLAEPGYGGLKASSTGEAARSAIVNYWRSKGSNGAYFILADGGYCGNPGRIPDINSIITRLDDQQRLGRNQLTTRAYQETHQDLRALYYEHVEPQLECAIRRDPTVSSIWKHYAVCFSCQGNGNTFSPNKGSDIYRRISRLSCGWGTSGYEGEEHFISLFVVKEHSKGRFPFLELIIWMMEICF